MQSANTNVFAPPKPFVTPSNRVRYGILSNIGGRENNEDAAVAILLSGELTGAPPPVGLFLVADGMGGHKDGERASSLTARKVAYEILKDLIGPMVENRDIDTRVETIQDALANAVRMANAAVRQEVSGGGTTLSCMVMMGEMAHFAHIGDSRAYLFDEGDLEQITRDHSMAERLREIGQDQDLPLRNVLYKAIGAGDQVEPDTISRRLPPGSKVMLCSDGLWDSLGDDTIRWLLDQTPDPQEACERLIAAANTNNVEDNVTAVVVQMPD
jgi:serine/threonine protein phosphatase PrpC